ncbi:ATP-binding protein [Candidatus Uhrbacteria bacterium]|nr:ATP-binding protein [Candidatus Uhrbacteria bacterium]
MKNRFILAKIWEEIDSPNIDLLTGPRQVGKTTLLQMVREKLLAERGVNSSSIHWFDLEQSTDLEIWRDQTKALSRLPLNASEKHYVFIDEFQLSPTIGSTLKVIHDHYPHIKCLATGSLSWWVAIDESMAGRKQVINVWPLSFAEFADWNQNEQLNRLFTTIHNNPASQITASEIETANQEMLRYMAYGGYPAVANTMDNSAKASLLNELVNSFITRDIQHFNRAADPVQTRKLLMLLASNSSSIFDISRISTDSGMGRTALLNRVGWLEHMFIIRLVRPFFTNKTKELVKNPKIYLDDLGLRNLLLQNYSVLPATNEFGYIAENFVANELFKQTDDFLHPLHFWRTKTGQEVDIIIKSGHDATPFEIKGGNCENIPAGLLAFIKTYRPKEAYVLNWAVMKTEKHFDCAVHFRPLWWAGILAKSF